MPHGEDHVKRVVNLALLIAKKEGGDLDVIKKAAELHDIARDQKDHAISSAKIAEKILRKEGYDKDFIKKVCHCIESHSFSSKIEPKTLEAKILSDADKLDAIGAIGIARAFMFAGERGKSLRDALKHFEDKLLKLKDMMHTDTAKKIAKKRHKFLKEFYYKILEELNLNDAEDHAR